MDIFVFNGVPSLGLTDGKVVQGYTSATWVERYSGPGDFEIVAPLSSGLKTLLPLGSLISHRNTYEFAIVENHEITESKDSEPELKVTGRSFDSYFENRIVGVDSSYFYGYVPYVNYTLASAQSHVQAYQLLVDHLITPLISDNSLDNYLRVRYSNLPIYGQATQDEVTMGRDDLASSLSNLLAIDNLGIKTIRRSQTSEFGAYTYYDKSGIVIHPGLDKSDKVIFSWLSGELDSVNYLISQKPDRNCAVVQGNWVEEFVIPSGLSAYDRRFMKVDGSDIDARYTSAPTGTDLTTVRSLMHARGTQELAKNKVVDIVAADISKLNQYKYRVDYDIGDIVAIDGSYGEIEKRRVIEHVEIEDENGDISYPTLEAI